MKHLVDQYREVVKHFNASDQLGNGTTAVRRDLGMSFHLYPFTEPRYEISARTSAGFWQVTVWTDGSLSHFNSNTPAEIVDILVATQA